MASIIKIASLEQCDEEILFSNERRTVLIYNSSISMEHRALLPAIFSSNGGAVYMVDASQFPVAQVLDIYDFPTLVVMQDERIVNWITGFKRIENWLTQCKRE